MGYAKKITKKDFFSHFFFTLRNHVANIIVDTGSHCRLGEGQHTLQGLYRMNKSVYG